MTDSQRVQRTANQQVMAHVSKTSYKGEKLKGADNYPTWAFAFKAFLRGRKAGALITCKTESDQEDEVYAQLVAAVEPSVMVHIMATETVFDAWRILKNQYATSSTAHAVAIERDLRGADYKGKGSLEEYLSTMKTKLFKLKAAGGTMSDGEFVKVLLTNVTAQHLQVVVTVLLRTANLTVEAICSDLLLEDARIRPKQGGGHGEGESALFTGDRTESRKKKEKSKETRKCFECGKQGHLAKDCRSKAKESAKKAKQEKEFLLTAFVLEESSDVVNTVLDDEDVPGLITDDSEDDGEVPGAESENEEEHLKAAKAGCAEHVVNTELDDEDVPGLITDDSEDDGEVPDTRSENEKEHLKAARASFEEDQHKDYLWADSGASSHMCGDKTRFQDYEELAVPVEISLGDERKIKAMGKGKIHVQALNGSMIKLTKVLYVPHVKTGLFSISAACDAGAEGVVFTKDHCRMKLKGDVIDIGKRLGKLYQIKLPVLESAKVAVVSTEVWHARRGHVNFATLREDAQNKTVQGMSIKDDDPSACESCQQGKAAKLPMPDHATRRATQINALVHSDVIGPMPVESKSGKRYVLTFVDDWSRYTTVFFLRKKSEVFGKFKEYKVYMETQYDHRVKCLRSDNGGEYTSKEFEDYLRSAGIKHEKSIPRRQAQNCVAERMGRTLLEMARTILHHASMAKSWWAEAVNTSCYLRNRSSSRALDVGVTPYEKVHNAKPDVAHLRTWGCRAMYKDDKARKLDSKARRGIFVGYPEATKGYRVYDPVLSKVAITRDVVFYEDQFGGDDDDEVPDLMSESEDDQDDAGGEEQEETQERRSERERKAPVRYGLDEYAGMAVEEILLTAQGDPRTRREALESANAQEWQVAIDDELRSLNKNQTWELCPRPADRKVIDGRWVFKVKRDQDGNPSRYKARYVARGFTQVPGTDFMDTYAPVASTTMQRALLSMAAVNDLEIYQLDIETSFQHQDVREELYIELPEGYIFPEETSRKTHCGRLQKALYGLKQAAFELDRKIRDVLTKAGYTFSREDPCVFYRVHKGNYLVCTIHIDDLCVATTVRPMYEDLKRALEREFPVKDLGEVNFLLGCKIERNRKRRTLALSQEAYARRAVERFNLHDAKPVATPSSTSMQLKKGPAVDSGFPYREAVGTLMYLAVMTRPDIMEAVSAVARFVECPTAEHVTAVKRILRYVKGTIEHGIVFGRENGLRVYVDATWAQDPDDRRSVSGMLMLLNGGAVAYFSRRQKCIALSSTEAEYVAASEAAKVAVWLKRVLHELPGFTMGDGPLTVYEDNQGCLAMIASPTSSRRTKHIDVRYHYLRELVRDEILKFEYVPTEEML